MNGTEYANLVAAYVVANFGGRGLAVYREIYVGKSIIGKNRRIDLLVVDGATDRALGLECKIQESTGTTDEKIPYTLQDLAAMQLPAAVVYAGSGWSDGVRHLLESSAIAAYCLPDPATLERTTHTRELDHVLAQTFGWWDVLLEGRAPFDLEAWRRGREAAPVQGSLLP
jgi:hypothetical protein